MAGGLLAVEASYLAHTVKREFRPHTLHAHDQIVAAIIQRDGASCRAAVRRDMRSLVRDIEHAYTDEMGHVIDWLISTDRADRSHTMPDAVIVEAVRSPVGKRNGSLSHVHPADLSGYVLRALAERTGIDPADLDDVVWGCVNQAGDQAAQIGRYCVLAAGWPETVPGTTINRACGSSQQAVDFAAGMIMAGQYELVVAGGVESMSRVPLGAGQTADARSDHWCGSGTASS